MPLDPSIFMNSAALYAQGQQGLQNNIANAIQGYQQRRQQNELLDLERQKLAQEQAMKQAALQSPVEHAKRMEAMGQLAVFDALNGKQLDPESQAAAEFYVRSQTKPTFDPVSGRLVQNNPFSGILGKLQQPDVGASQAAPALPVQRRSLMDNLAPRTSAAPMNGDNMTPDAIGENLSPQVMASLPQGIQIDGLPSAAENPRLAQDLMTKQGEANIALQAKKAEAQPQAEASLRGATEKLDSVNKTINEILGDKENQGRINNWTTGAGSYLSMIRGTGASDLEEELNFIKSDAALGALVALKNQGGTLGAVSKDELILLKDSQAALSQSQSPAQFRKNLIKYQAARNSALKNVRQAYVDTYGKEPDLGTIGAADTQSAPAAPKGEFEGYSITIRKP